jgi:hypothetical protein
MVTYGVCISGSIRWVVTRQKMRIILFTIYHLVFFNFLNITYLNNRNYTTFVFLTFGLVVSVSHMFVLPLHPSSLAFPPCPFVHMNTFLYLSFWMLNTTSPHFNTKACSLVSWACSERIDQYFPLISVSLSHCVEVNTFMHISGYEL